MKLRHVKEHRADSFDSTARRFNGDKQKRGAVVAAPLNELVPMFELIRVNQLERQSCLLAVRVARPDFENRAIGHVLAELHTP